MPPKKRNAFYYFMLDYKNDQARRGNNLSMTQVSQVAGPIWSSLSAHEKQRYENKTKTDRAGDEKYTSKGIPFSHIEKQEKEMKQRQKDMEINITDTIHLSIGNLGIDKQVYFILHVNHYVFYSDKNVYLPAEIAIVKFNLCDGVLDIYHSIIDPGPIPIGYQFATKNTCDSSHRLPVPPHDKGKNMRTVLAEVCNFISNDDDTLPPLYVVPNNQDVAENVFQNYLQMNSRDSDFIKVYSLPLLFYHLRNIVCNHVQKEEAFPAASLAEVELERDVYEYCRDIACDYHSSTDIYYFCSKSKATRYAYVLCDHICQDLDIKLVPGKHVPLVAKIPCAAGSYDRYARSPSQMSSISSLDQDFRPEDRRRRENTQERYETTLSIADSFRGLHLQDSEDTSGMNDQVPESLFTSGLSSITTAANSRPANERHSPAGSLYDFSFPPLSSSSSSIGRGRCRYRKTK